MKRLLQAANFSFIWTSYLPILLALSAKSILVYLKSIGARPTFFWEEPYEGQKLAIVALYQKGRLRKDSERLLKALKERDCYVLAVNTLKLKDPETCREYVDCYVERFNFGRDFGSYKAAFQTVFARGWHESCPRALIINDSVYCISDRIGPFIDEIMNSDIEVLGSTENYETSHHLGSFCIAFCGRILRHKKFRKYWKKYRNSDIRPTVIHRGELELSKTLRKCATNPTEFQAVYGTGAFLAGLQNDDELIDDAIRKSRYSALTAWRRFSVPKVIEELRKRYLFQTVTLPKDASLQIEELQLGERVAANSLAGIIELAQSDLKQGQVLDHDHVRRVVISHLTESFMVGSQIHQNASILVRLGLPIVKLDGLYRGMFTVQDIQLICEQLPEVDRLELQALLLERPFGGNIYIGWKYAAFMRGLI